MPNWCSNNVTINANGDKELQKKLREALAEDNKQDLFCQFVPQPKFENEDEWYGWNITNWGTKWDAMADNIIWEDDNIVKFSLETAWSPPTAFYEKMEELGYEIEAYYCEEGMAFVGCYSDGDDDYYEYGDMSAADMEDSLPDWVEDQFCLISRKQDDEDQELEDLQADWERTEWYPVKIKPVRFGMYEVKTKSWPWPHKVEFDGDGWNANDNEVTEWRGITEIQYFQNALDGLTELVDDMEKVPCYSCDEPYSEDELIIMEGQYICPNCGEGWVMPDDRSGTI